MKIERITIHVRLIVGATTDSLKEPMVYLYLMLELSQRDWNEEERKAEAWSVLYKKRP